MPKTAEIRPCEPDTDNTGVGSFLFEFSIACVMSFILEAMENFLFSTLCIGGSDNSGGAGIQADNKAVTLAGAHAMTAVTAVTAQNEKGVKALEALSPRILKAQLEACLEITFPDAVKIGMTASYENADVILDFIRMIPASVPIVIDPVLKASSGGNLFNPNDNSLNKWIEKYIDILKTGNSFLTPNLAEATVFLDYFGKRNLFDTNNLFSREISALKEISVVLLSLLSCKGIVLKGGHHEGNKIPDVITFKDNDGKEKTIVKWKQKMDCTNLHGTGCVFSSLFATWMGMGFSIDEAFEKTSATMETVISKSCDYRLGTQTYGPLNLFDYTTK